jgi:hypothetical protein
VAATIIDDPSAPVFFLSYSRPDRSRPVAAPQEPNRHVMRFFDELTENVNELVGSPAGQDPGFVDLGRGGGESWQETVLGAVGTCQVFVCLLSRPLLKSPWCCREWDAFARRAVVPRGGSARPGDTAIVPVLWAPLSDPMPPMVAKINVFRPTGLPKEHYAARYLANGLFGLLRSEPDIYEAILWKLALHIQRIHTQYWVEPRIPAGVDDLRTSFDEGVP